MQLRSNYLPKDFIETRHGLIFAVVDPVVEQGHVLCFLRYVRENGVCRKHDTAAANAYLTDRYPQYLYHSTRLDARLHAVPVAEISRHYQPEAVLKTLPAMSRPDAVVAGLSKLLALLQTQSVDPNALGITGSVLIGAQNADSDIDLVCYERAVFNQCRVAVQNLIETGRLQQLSDEDWLASYRRRGCALSFPEYLWHEQRKANKAIIDGRKFDLSLVLTTPAKSYGSVKKLGKTVIQCRISEDQYGFDYPAEFRADHATITAIVSYTATYNGQARIGEWVEACGTLEQDAQGLLRMVIGSDREAQGEYLKVIPGHA